MLAGSGCARRCEQVVEGLDRLRPRRRVEDEPVSLARVLKPDAESVAGIAVTPEQVDGDPGGLPVPEMSVLAGYPPPCMSALREFHDAGRCGWCRCG